jgi:hypothetical protein
MGSVVCSGGESADFFGWHSCAVPGVDSPRCIVDFGIKNDLSKGYKKCSAQSIHALDCIGET